MKFNIILLFLLSFVNVFSQKLLKEITVDQLINSASAIVSGEVISKESYIDDQTGRIYTKNLVQVHHLFKGQAFDTVSVITKGGSVGLEVEEYHPALKLRESQVGVFMLNKDGSLYADLQGFFEYDIYENKVFGIFNFYESIESFEDLVYSFTSRKSIKKSPIFPFQKVKPTYLQKQVSTNTISSFTPSLVRAGIGETITISGSGFGNVKGNIRFRNADTGGISYVDVYTNDIISWSNTSIRVEIPYLAGTGTFQVITANNETFNTSSALTVISSESSVEFSQYPNTYFRRKLINQDGQGGYTWVFSDAFFENSEAVATFQRAVDTWVCATNISWLVSEESTDELEANNDGINVVALKYDDDEHASELEPGMLAIARTHTMGCIVPGGVNAYISDVDITFNRYFEWNFTENDPEDWQYDFEGTAAHELGHAHNLGHVIDEDTLMHFDTAPGTDSATRDIDWNTINAAKLAYEYSETNGICSQDFVVSRGCMDYSTIEVVPVDYVTITNNGDATFSVINTDYLWVLRVFDISGKFILETTERTVDLSNYHSGIYIFYVEYDAAGEEYFKVVR